MEMEEMKIAWTRMETRLGETEKINGKILRDMLARRAARGTGGLMTYVVISTLILFAIIPYLIYWGGVLAAHYTSVAQNVFFCLTGLILLAAIPTQFYKLRLLSRIDMNAPILDNLLRLERYRLFLHREKVVTFIMLGLLLLMPFWMLWDIRQLIPSWLWAALVALVPAAALLGYYTYQKLNLQLQKIRRSFSELDELNETDA